MARTESTQRWGLFTEMERRADVETLRSRFAFDCIYYRTGGWANFKWHRAIVKPTQREIDVIERAGYPAVPGRQADGPPKRFAVEGWDDLRCVRVSQ